MADHGSIATLGNLTKSAGGLVQPSFFRGINCEAVSFTAGARNNVEGDPSQPCLELFGPGMWRFRWSFASGSRSISISVMQVSDSTPRPTLTVKANPDCGVNADVTGTAGSGVGWVTIGPVNITPTSSGAVWVELRSNYQAPESSFWDNIETT